MASQTIDDEEPNLPLFLGIYSLEVGVQAICISHGLACVILLSLASSVVGVTVMGEFVSPEFQVCLAAWCLLGIGLTAASLVACARKQAYPLQVYFYYLLLTCIALVVLGVHLYQEGADCDMVSRTKTSQRLGISWSCGLVSVTWLLCLGSIFTFLGYGMWMLWCYKEELLRRERCALLKERVAKLDDHLRDHLCTEDGGTGDLAATGIPLSWAAPTLGSQPPWSGFVPNLLTTVTPPPRRRASELKEAQHLFPAGYVSRAQH